MGDPPRRRPKRRDDRRLLLPSPTTKRPPEEEPNDAFIASRHVNALIHSGRTDRGPASCLALVAATKGSDDSLPTPRLGLRGRPPRQGTRRRSPQLPEIGKRRRSLHRPALAATLDYVGQKDAAFATLDDYLQAHPTNLDVLGRLLKRVNSPDTFARGPPGDRPRPRRRPRQARRHHQALQCPSPRLPAAAPYVAQLPANAPAQDISGTAAYLCAPSRCRPAKHNPFSYRCHLPRRHHCRTPRSNPRATTTSPGSSPRRQLPGSFLAGTRRDLLPAGESCPRTSHASSSNLRPRAEAPYSSALPHETKNQKEMPRQPRYPPAGSPPSTASATKDAAADAELNRLIDDFPKFESAYIAMIKAGRS